MKKFLLGALTFACAWICAGTEMILQDIPFRAGDLKAKIIDNWMLQPGWGGEISRSNGVLTFKSTDTGKRVWGRIMSPLRNCNPTGLKIVLTCRVKGSGQFSIGAYSYKPGTNKPDGVSWSEPVALTGEYQEIRHELDYTGSVLRNVNLVMDLKGEGEALVDWTRATAEVDTTVEIDPVPGVFVREGDPVADLRFRTNRPNGKFFYCIKRPATEMFDPGKELTADADGVVTISGGELPLQPAAYEVLLGAAGNGMPRISVPGACRHCRFAMNEEKYVGVASVVRIPAAEWEENIAAAKAVNPEGKRKILVLADSIWDFDRGSNVADRLEFFLRQAHGDSIQIANYAVHGDNVHRMLCRFVGRFKEVAHGAKRYQTIRDENPEMILFMLGHNDVAASSRDNFEKPGVAFDVQRSSMEALVVALKKQWPAAKIVFLTPLSVDTKTIRARVAARLKEKNPGVIFRYGDDDKVAEYRKILESVAQKYQIPVWDIYTPMENLENKPSYFYPDSVHLSSKGHALLARLLLKEMAK